jgi:ATP-dependent exoDNAse (exonuclease V) beta subunit
MKRLEKWKETGLSKARPGAEAQIHDRYEIMKLFIEEKPTLGEAMDYFTEVMSSEGSIKLMTGHKAKGLEFEQVFFLDQHRCDIEKDQDANIKYVIQTRALSELNYVTSEGWSNGAG